MKRTFITYKGSVYDAIEIEAYKIDKEVTDENNLKSIFDNVKKLSEEDNDNNSCNVIN